MEFIVNKRADHAEQYNTERVYKEYFDRAMKEGTYLSELLSDVDCTIKITPNDQSWCDNDVTIEYQGYVFTAREDYHKKIYIHAYSENKYRIVVKENYEGKYIPNYTFYKLTTKKLLTILNERVKEYQWLRAKAEETENINNKKFIEACKDLKWVADNMGEKVKISKDTHSIVHTLFTPIGQYTVSYDKYSKQVFTDYKLSQLITFINMLK